MLQWSNVYFFIMYCKIKIQLLISKKEKLHRSIKMEIFHDNFNSIYSNENMILNTSTKRINLYDSAWILMYRWYGNSSTKKCPTNQSMVLISNGNY